MSGSDQISGFKMALLPKFDFHYQNTGSFFFVIQIKLLLRTNTQLRYVLNSRMGACAWEALASVPEQQLF